MRLIMTGLRFVVTAVLVSCVVLSAGAVSAAVAGWLIYIPASVERVDISALEAGCFANCAISAGAWDGAVSDMVRTCAERKAGGGFEAWTRGYRYAPAADVPPGSVLYGVATE